MTESFVYVVTTFFCVVTTLVSTLIFSLSMMAESVSSRYDIRRLFKRSDRSLRYEMKTLFRLLRIFFMDKSRTCWAVSHDINRIESILSIIDLDCIRKAS